MLLWITIAVGLLLCILFAGLAFAFKRRRPVAVVALLAAGALLGITGIPFWMARQSVAAQSASAPTSPPPAALVTAEDYLAQGDYEFDRRNYQAAIAAYSRAIELKPDFAAAYNNRAYTYMTLENYAPALPDLDRAIALRPDYVSALMNRGDIHNYYYAINYDQAIADYDRALQSGAAHTSVCGHRMLAVHHGWNPGVLLDIATHGVEAGCP